MELPKCGLHSKEIDLFKAQYHNVLSFQGSFLLFDFEWYKTEFQMAWFADPKIIASN